MSDRPDLTPVHGCPKGWHASPSQIKTFEDCPRKWAFSQLDDVDDPGNKFSTNGIQGHKLVEGYLLRGDVPDPTAPLGLAAQAMISMLRLPPKHPAVQVERFWDFTLPLTKGSDETVRILGYMDVFASPPNGIPIIADHKFTSNLDYALTEDQLAETDIAATLYAAYAMVTTGQDQCKLMWNYVDMNKPTKTKAVHVVTTWDRIFPRVERSLQIARTMRYLRTWDQNTEGPVSNQILPCPSACSKFAGCPMAPLCNLTPEQMFSRGNK